MITQVLHCPSCHPLEFNNKVKRLRLALGMAKALMVGDTGEEAVILTAQIEAFRATLDEMASS